MSSILHQKLLWERQAKHRCENHKVAELPEDYSIRNLISSGFFIYISDTTTCDVFYLRLEGFKAIYIFTFVWFLLQDGYGLLKLQSILYTQKQLLTSSLDLSSVIEAIHCKPQKKAAEMGEK